MFQEELECLTSKIMQKKKEFDRNRQLECNEFQFIFSKFAIPFHIIIFIYFNKTDQIRFIFHKILNCRIEFDKNPTRSKFECSALNFFEHLLCFSGL